MKRQGSDDLDAGDLFQFAELLDRDVSLASDKALGGEADGNDGGARVDLGGNSHFFDQLRKEDAAGAKPRISNRTGRKQRRAQRGLGRDIRMGGCPP